jgi:hypothetical protein
VAKIANGTLFRGRLSGNAALDAKTPAIPVEESAIASANRAPPDMPAV